MFARKALWFVAAVLLVALLASAVDAKNGKRRKHRKVNKHAGANMRFKQKALGKKKHVTAIKDKKFIGGLGEMISNGVNAVSDAIFGSDEGASGMSDQDAAIDSAVDAAPDGATDSEVEQVLAKGNQIVDKWNGHAEKGLVGEHVGPKIVQDIRDSMDKEWMESKPEGMQITVKDLIDAALNNEGLPDATGTLNPAQVKELLASLANSNSKSREYYKQPFTAEELKNHAGEWAAGEAYKLVNDGKEMDFSSKLDPAKKKLLEELLNSAGDSGESSAQEKQALAKVGEVSNAVESMSEKVEAELADAPDTPEANKLKSELGQVQSELEDLKETPPGSQTGPDPAEASKDLVEKMGELQQSLGEVQKEKADALQEQIAGVEKDAAEVASVPSVQPEPEAPAAKPAEPHVPGSTLKEFPMGEGATTLGLPEDEGLLGKMHKVKGMIVDTDSMQTENDPGWAPGAIIEEGAGDGGDAAPAEADQAAADGDGGEGGSGDGAADAPEQTAE